MAVTVKIEGEELNFTFTTTISKAGQIITFLGTDRSEEEGVIYPHTESNSPQLLPISIKNKTPRQALIDSRARTNSQKITVLGYYYVEVNNAPTFPRSELKELFGKVGETSPKNLHRDLKEAVIANYIYEQNPGEYIITEFGKESVNNGFFSDVQSVRKQSPKGPSKKGVFKKVISEEVKSLEIINTLGGFPDYWSLKQKGDRILWLFAFAEKNGVTLLSTADIEYLANRLRDNIPTSSFTALTETIFKRSHITRNGDKYKILQPGIDYLASKIKEEG